jgi:hypothetical protein
VLEHHDIAIDVGMWLVTLGLRVDAFGPRFSFEDAYACQRELQVTPGFRKLSIFGSGSQGGRGLDLTRPLSRQAAGDYFQLVA